MLSLLDFPFVSAAGSVVAAVGGNVGHVVVLWGRRRQRLGRRVRISETVVRAHRARCRPGVHGRRRRLVGRLPRPQLSILHIADVLSLVLLVLLLLLEVLVDVDRVGDEVGQGELRVRCGLFQNPFCRRGVRHVAFVRSHGLEAGFARRVVASWKKQAKKVNSPMQDLVLRCGLWINDIPCRNW